MKNLKFPFFFGLLLGSLAFFFAQQPIVFAAYDCSYNIADPSTCCLAGQTGYNGVYCDPGQFIQKIGTTSPICKSSADILTRRDLANTKLFAGFNCFNDQLNKTCQNTATQCYDAGTDKCQVFAGPQAACTSANRETLCNLSCGGCKSGFIQCGGICKAPQAAACGAGYQVDQCTGLCSCPTGTVPSGIFPNSCISYFQRFGEILDFGLAILGGPNKDGKYDYSVTGVNDYLKNVLLKADVAETLNWASPTLPPVFQDLITNNGNNSYILCTATQPCPGTMTCSDGGLCYTASGTVGTACANVSQCNLGLVCDITGKCADPHAGLTSCVTDANCTAPKTCGTDHYCHNPNNNAGDVCAVNADCADGLFCSNSICVNLNALTGIKYKGMTATTAFNGVLTGYAEANDKCNATAPSSAFSGSHVCTVEEMLFLVNNNPASLPGSGRGWINGGPPGFVAVANDCESWTVKPASPADGDWLKNSYGKFWNFATKSAGITTCNMQNIPFLCCK